MFHYLQESDVISGKLSNDFSFHIPPNSLCTYYNIAADFTYLEGVAKQVFLNQH
jgi:hypothetical protein